MRYLYKFTGTKAKNPQPSSAPKQETQKAHRGLLALGTLFILLALCPNVSTAQAFDFWAQCSTGQNLCYKIISGTNNVALTYPDESTHSWNGYASNKPWGFMALPDSVFGRKT